MAKRQILTPQDQKLYIYAQNSIQKLASYEDSFREKWLEFQKNNPNTEGSFVYAYQIYHSKRLVPETEYLAEINSMNGNKYIVMLDGEIKVIKKKNE